MTKQQYFVVIQQSGFCLAENEEEAKEIGKKSFSLKSAEITAELDAYGVGKNGK